MKGSLVLVALTLMLTLVLASCGGSGAGSSGSSATSKAATGGPSASSKATTSSSGAGGGVYGSQKGGSTSSASKSAASGGASSEGTTTIRGVKSYSNLSRKHTRKPVNYAQTPPVGGPHNPLPQTCGFYSKPVQNEHAVHSMEHGAVWITFRPDLPKDQVEKIKGLAQKSYVLASPYPGLPSPVVASAWGKQLKLNSASDPRLERFVNAYRQGPQTPEPGAPCRGVGHPG